MAFKKLISTVSVLILILLGLTGSLWAETVTVTVQTDEESALSGRLVYAYTDTDTYTGVARTADSNGLALFESDDFSAGNYKFRTDFLNIQFWSDEVAIPGDTEIDLVIEMERVEVLLSMAGSPLENINIYLFNESGTYLSQNLNTTADGTVAFDLPVGHNFKFRADILSTYYWSEIVTITGGGTNQVPFNAGGGLLEITLKEDTVTPMAGIKLYLYNTSGGYLGQLSTTDAAGIASFVVAAGTYRVRADYLGYQFWSLDTEVTADRAIEFIIPHRVVTLTVNNSYQSNPTGLEGVKVYLFTAGGTYQGQYANTDANGQVSFRLPEQAYKARVDYLSRHYWSTDFVWVDQEINIDHAQAEISVTGVGLPVSGLAVYLFSGSGAYLNRYETTDGAGKVTYGLPAEGTFKFRVTYEGSQYWTDEMTLTANEVNPIDLSVGGGTFALTVLKRPGVPLPDALCYLYNESGTYLNINATTDQNGQVSFDLADGTYKFRVDQLGYQFWSDLFLVPDVLAADFEITHQMITITVNDSYQGADAGLSGVPVYLFTSGEAYQGIMQNTDGNGQIILDLPDEAYKVRVDYLNQQFWSTDFTGQDRSVDIGMAEAEVTVSGAGLPAEGINVYVFSGSDTYLNLQAVTDAEGKGRFRLPAAGTYKFRADYEGSQYWTEEISLTVDQVNAIALSAGGGTFALTVLKGPGTPLVGAPCYVFNQAGEYLDFNDITDNNGQVFFELADGNYQFRIDLLGYQFMSNVFAVPAVLAADFEITHQDVTITVNDAYQSETTGMADLPVYLFTAGDAYQSLYQNTDGTGQVTFSLPNRAYKVRVDYLNHEYWSTDFIQQDRAVDIEMAEVEVTLSGAGQPTEGLPVYVFNGAETYLNINSPSDAAGKVLFRLPAAGSYKFRVDYEGSQYWSNETTLTAHQVNAVTLTTGGGTFALTVLKGPGDPLENVTCYLFNAAGTYLGLNAVTDNTGLVSFDLADGDFKFRVDHLGYQFWSDVYPVPAVLTADFEVTHQVVTITVNDSYQSVTAGLEGVPVYLFTGADVYQNQNPATDADGRVAFNLPEEPYKVRVDYLNQQFWSDAFTGQDRAVNIVMAEADITVTESGAGAPDITVYAFLDSGVYLNLNQVTDTNGKAHFRLPASGGYKFRADHEGSQYWTEETALIADLVNPVVISLDGDVSLPIIEAHPLDLTVNEGEAATLSVVVTGVNLNYQWQKDEADIPGAVGAEYALALAALTDCGSYRCAVTNSAGTVMSNPAVLTINMNLPANTTPITGISAQWTEGQARLSWDALADVKYRIFRGTDQNGLAALIDTDTPEFHDPSAQYFQTYYYQGAVIKEYIHPCTLEVHQQIGPLTPVLTLTGLPAANITITNGQVLANGAYQLFFNSVSPYAVTGTYQNLTGAVTVTAVQGAATITGTGGSGQFSQALTTGGDWQVTVAEQGGWKQGNVELQLVIDSDPPQLTVDGPAERSTTGPEITLTGLVIDAGVGLHEVVVSSDRYSGQLFNAVVNAQGLFTVELPLHTGLNQLGLTAEDLVGNSSQQNVAVTLQVSALPVITIDTPVNGGTVTDAQVDFTGIVRSSLAPEEISLAFRDRLQFPAGSNNEYHFNFDDVTLTPGVNTLSVTATTVHGNVSAQTMVTYSDGTGDPESDGPVIELSSAAQADVYQTSDTIMVSGSACSPFGITSVTVNGQAVETVGSGECVSFDYELSFSGAGTDSLEVLVAATDGEGRTTTAPSYFVHYDNTPPVIAMTAAVGLDPAPVINSVVRTPYPITGIITEKNLAGVAINDRQIDILLPGAGEDQWTFDIDIDLVRDTQRELMVEAWDWAGHRTGYDLILRLDAALDIEVISPSPIEELAASDTFIDVEIVIRAPGMMTDDQVFVQIDSGTAVALSHNETTALGEINMAAVTGLHRLDVEIKDASETVLAVTTSDFTIVNIEDIPIAVERQEPENNTSGVEPNAFIAFYFNRPIDPALLGIEVLETAHGKTYTEPEPGADITRMNDIQLIDVHRELEAVPGGFSHFPEKTLVVFYAQRDFAYNGTIYVALTYDNQELYRSSFRIRPLPTFIQGFVGDQFNVPIAGIEVTIPELGRTALTNNEGAYSFGFGDQATETISGRRYLLEVNSGLKNNTFGAVEFYLNVEEGRLNQAGMKKIPILNPEEPFRRIYSGQTGALLAREGLTLDLSQAQLYFPDGRDRGDVHVQFTTFQEIPYPTLPSSMAHWVYMVQPMGIEVTGQVGLTLAMPSLYDSYDYITGIGERVLLVGLDARSLQIVPVGVGAVDAENRQVTHEGSVHLDRLDCLGYALVSESAQEHLKAYAEGEINLGELIGILETAR